MPQLRPLEFGGGFDGHSFIGQAAKSAADTVSSTVTVSTPDLVFSSLHSPFPSSASSASSLSVYSTTDSYVESSPTVSVVVTPPTGPSSGSQTPSNEPEEPPLTAASTNRVFRRGRPYTYRIQLCPADLLFSRGPVTDHHNGTCYRLSIDPHSMRIALYRNV